MGWTPSGLAEIVNWMWTGDRREGGDAPLWLHVESPGLLEALTSPLLFLLIGLDGAPAVAVIPDSPGDSDVQPLDQCSVAQCVPRGLVWTMAGGWQGWASPPLYEPR